MNIIEKYLTPANYTYWLEQNFEDSELQDMLDTQAEDDAYPEEFIQYCYDSQAFDSERTVWPVTDINPPLQQPEDEEIDHEFHFMEAPLHDDEQYNKEE